jgi:hypothetical protein
MPSQVPRAACGGRQIIALLRVRHASYHSIAACASFHHSPLSLPANLWSGKEAERKHLFTMKAIALPSQPHDAHARIGCLGTTNLSGRWHMLCLRRGVELNSD